MQTILWTDEIKVQLIFQTYAESCTGVKYNLAFRLSTLNVNNKCSDYNDTSYSWYYQELTGWRGDASIIG